MRARPALVATLVLACMSSYALDLRSFETRYDDGRYHIKLAAWLDATPDAFEHVLTDFANYPKLDPQIRWTRLTWRPGNEHLIVESMFHACVGVVCRDVRRLEQVERRDGQLDVTALPGGDMRSGSSRTRWRADGRGTFLEYDAEFQLAFWLPGVVARNGALRTIAEATVTLFGGVERQAHGH